MPTRENTEKSKSKRATRDEVRERVLFVARLIGLRKAPRYSDRIKIIMSEFDISEKQAERYHARAEKERKKKYEGDLEEMFALQLSDIQALLDEAIASGKHSTATALLAQRAKLLGLNKQATEVNIKKNDSPKVSLMAPSRLKEQRN